MAGDLLRRGLHDRLRKALQSVPVVVLEGARSIGKTTLAEQLRADGSLREIADLLDPGVLERAEREPFAFVDSLHLPAAVDEAQLVADLLLAVKSRVDKETGAGSVLLTGSARIGASGLGGSDPLAGRAVRLRLRSLTQGEHQGVPVNLVPELFDREFVSTERFPSVSKTELRRRACRGGIPRVMLAESERATLIDEMVTGAVRLSTQGTRVDRLRLRDFFKHMAASTPTPQNVSRYARDRGLHRETVRADLDRLEQAFLIDRLPPYSGGSMSARNGAPKIVSSDSALAAWACGMTEFTDDDNVLGPVAETFVIQELLAQAGWSEDISAAHWRHADNDEVDLVLVDRQRRAVAIEIKTAARYRSEHAKGVRAFARRAKQRFHRGIVFYGGEEVVVDTDGIVAVPISALWTPRAREIEVNDSARLDELAKRAATSASITLFVSYVHDDDEAEDGAILGLAEKLGERLGFHASKTVEVITDQKLRWGEDWARTLDDQVRDATFLLAIVTPNFLRSDACRTEVRNFNALQGPGRVLLPLRYQDPRAVNDDDPVWSLLKSRQMLDWRENKYLEPGSASYRRQVDAMVAQILGHLDDDADESSLGVPATDLDPNEPGPGLLEELAELADLEDRLGPWMESIQDLGDVLGSRLQSLPTEPAKLTAAFASAAHDAKTHVADLRERNDAMANDLRRMSRVMGELIETAEESPKLMEGVLSKVVWIHQTADEMDASLGQFQELDGMLTVMRRMSKSLRPAVDELRRALRLATDLAMEVKAWSGRVERLER